MRIRSALLVPCRTLLARLASALGTSLRVGRRGRAGLNAFCSSPECRCLGVEGWHVPCWRWVSLCLEFVLGIPSGCSASVYPSHLGIKTNGKRIEAPFSRWGFLYKEPNPTLLLWRSGYKYNAVSSAQRSDLVSFV